MWIVEGGKAQKKRSRRDQTRDGKCLKAVSVKEGEAFDEGKARGGERRARVENGR